MKFDVTPASDHLLPDLVQTLNRGFEGYLVPIRLDVSQFLSMVHKDSIDLSASRVLLADDKPEGVALIARRGWVSRLAAMGISKEMRGQGAGSWLMERLLQQARARGDREMTLEVIEQNDAAVRLYEKFGFQTMRRLVGFIRREAIELDPEELNEMDLREMGALVSQFGLRDLPWQLSGETIAQMTPPVRAYRNGHSYVAISNPEADHVVIWSVLVEPEARGANLGAQAVKQVIAKFTGRTWHVPAIYPEELSDVFVRAGFEREELSQWQMCLPLSAVTESVG
ncbi:MAG: GNAT family N-acetyltransferase [Anaerolineales bacterium]|nr:GNAT family N-acetyltransferase [Anaerolineales bacterium]